MLAFRKSHRNDPPALTDIPEPIAGPGEAIVEVAAAGICGSDLHISHGSPSYEFVHDRLPVVLGHELSGVVVSVSGEGGSISSGDRVVIQPSVPCGACAHCTAGDRDRCETRSGIGMTRDGGFARFVSVPTDNLIALPPELPLDVASLTEPLTVAWQAVARAGPIASRRVLVVGPGTIGVAIAMLARDAGADEVCLCGRNDAARLATARLLGIADTIDVASAEADTPERREFDVVFDASGDAGGVAFGYSRLRKLGVMVLVGLYGKPLSFEADDMVRQQIDIRGSHRAPARAWREILDVLSVDPDRFRPMITDYAPLDDAVVGFARAEARAATKVLICPMRTEQFSTL